MGNVHPNIKPGGLTQLDLVDWIYMFLYSLKGLCTKLDSDSGVADTNYTALCFTALFNIVITDSKGNYLNAAATESSTLEKTVIITPTGITPEAINNFLYQAYNAMETLTEKLDADGTVTDTDYEALCYIAIMLHMVENIRGNQLGNGNTYYFRPGGPTPEDHLINAIYEITSAVNTLTAKLDADGTVNDTNYQALWFTATFLLRIEDTKGNQLGVSR